HHEQGAAVRYRAVVPVLVALLALAFAASASAVTQRPFVETFGSAEQPDLGQPSGVVVDKESGDVLIANARTNSIYRFHADGTPAPFSALGSNQIDGSETPQGHMSLGAGAPAQFQIAIDESTGPTKGDIYVTQPGFGNSEGTLVEAFVEIFAED